MGYRYLEDLAGADAAFEAWGETLEELFKDAADAVLGVMLEDPSALAPRETVTLRVEGEEVDWLLYRLLGELIYHKDARELLLRLSRVSVARDGDLYRLEAEARGESIGAHRDELEMDVKAVTLHHFQVERSAKGWKAVVVLDI